jgi:hypothetical protein
LFLNGIHMKLKSNEIKRFLHHVDGKWNVENENDVSAQFGVTAWMM